MLFAELLGPLINLLLKGAESLELSEGRNTVSTESTATTCAATSPAFLVLARFGRTLGHAGIRLEGLQQLVQAPQSTLLEFPRFLVRGVFGRHIELLIRGLEGFVGFVKA